jgi:peptidoglycan hydrolase-like protein with peptidoglycan-binding domain
MKKIFSFIICVVLFGVLSVPVVTNAVSDTQTAEELLTSLQTQIANLQVQITALNAQLQALKQAQSAVKETAKDVKGTLQLLNQLKPGMTSEEVKRLQEILATDPEIYPEGHITGYFGKLTEKAVKKLQNKFCLNQVGLVGPKTLAKINELLTEGAGSSGKVPPGLLTAPGIQKKFCTTLVPDTIAPVISSIEATNITASTAKIKWSTNELADSKIWYGTTTPVVTTSDPTKSSSAYVTSHEIELTGLTASTTYYYVVGSTDSSSNTTKSAEKSFTTSAPDTTAPVISSIEVINITASTAKIKWSTNELADSKIWYGTTTPVVTTSDPTKSSSAYVTSHEIELTGLTASTTYYYVVGSTDSSSNTTKSAERLFMTLAQ